MGKVPGKDTRVLVNEVDLSNYFNELGVAADAGLVDVTAFTDAGRKRKPGLLDGTITASGYFDGAADAVDEEFNAAFGSASPQVVTVAPEQFTVGNRAKLMSSREARYSVTSPVDGAVATSAEMLSDDRGVQAGHSLKDLGTSIAAQSSIDNSASSANGAAAHLHVTANTRNGSTTYIVEHSTDNSVWATLITFTAVGSSTKTSERKTVTGTVNRYVRAGAATQGGSTGTVTAHIGFARFN